MRSDHTRWILTGGIGSGKSTVGKMLRWRGVRVIDADLIGHGVLEPDGPGFASVSSRWPQVVTEGRIDRRALGRLVFENRELLSELEGMTHPHIVDVLLESVGELGERELAVVEISVPHNLLGVGWKTLVVDTSDDVRQRRLQERGMDPDEIERRMAAQPSREAWLESADHVITNDGGLDDLSAQVDAFLTAISGAD